jgi:hypothetical protein
VPGFTLIMTERGREARSLSQDAVPDRFSSGTAFTHLRNEDLMKPLRMALAAPLVGLVVLAACQSPVDVDQPEMIGIIDWRSTVEGGDNPAFLQLIEAPDNVPVNQTFEAKITTFGPTASWEPAGATLTLTPRLAIVTPYDRNREGQGACATVVVPLTRTVQLRFTEPGPAVLRVVGRQVVNGDQTKGVSAAVEKVIQVR